MMGDFNWKIMEKNLEGLSKRFEATSRNMANANTPEFARRNVSFEDQLREVVDGPEAPHDRHGRRAHPFGPPGRRSVVPEEIKVYDEKYGWTETTWIRKGKWRSCPRREWPTMP